MFLAMHRGIISVICPGTTMVIVPPRAHCGVELLFKAGMLASIRVGAPGAQGAGVLGTQGMRVSVKTPSAAVVAVRWLQRPQVWPCWCTCQTVGY